MSKFDVGISRATHLHFPIATVEGPTIVSIGDAADFLAKLPEERRAKHHWEVAIRMLDIALREPSYLKAATMSLQTALAMDGRLDQPFGQ